jgi:hypothetical protein
MIVVEHASLCCTVIMGRPNLSNLSKSAMELLKVGNVGALEKSNMASHLPLNNSMDLDSILIKPFVVELHQAEDNPIVHT